MIIYNPTDGDALVSKITSKPRHCFLMTRLGNPVPTVVHSVRKEITSCCRSNNYKVIDAGSSITGRDFLVKIWKMIAASPLSVGVVHEAIPQQTQENIYYELGVAQALGKETLIVKSPDAKIPSDFVRSEYILFDRKFKKNFSEYLKILDEQANHYETVSDQLDNNPVLALDYLKRAYLLTGSASLKKKAKKLVADSNLEGRAKSSVELLAAAF